MDKQSAKSVGCCTRSLDWTSGDVHGFNRGAAAPGEIPVDIGVVFGGWRLGGGLTLKPLIMDNIFFENGISTWYVLHSVIHNHLKIYYLRCPSGMLEDYSNPRTHSLTHLLLRRGGRGGKG